LILNFAAPSADRDRTLRPAATLGDIDAMIEAGQRWREAETRRIEGDLDATRNIVDFSLMVASDRRCIDGFYKKLTQPLGSHSLYLGHS